MESLSSRQREVFDALQDFIETHGYPPTMRDLAKKLGIVNPTAIKRMLDIFEEKGLLESVPGKSRAIHIKHPHKHLPEDIFSLPIAGRIVAGMPAEAIENVEDKISIPSFLAQNNPNAFLLTVKGDSMEPEFHAEDIVVINPQPSAYSGEVVAAMIEGEATIKQFLNTKGVSVLHPFNLRYPDIPLNAESKILGKVVGLLRKF